MNVYRHRRLDTNEIFYIGIGNDKRPYDFHKRSKWWLKIFNKTNINVEIIAKDLTKEEACKLEMFLISLYGRRDLGYGPLVNMTDGGDNGGLGSIRTQEHKDAIAKSNRNRIVSEETKKKISKSNKGKTKGRIVSNETREKLSKANKGKIISDETKEKLRQNNLGKKASDKTKEKMSLIHKGLPVHNQKIVLNLETGIFYDSINKAAISININKGILRDWLVGRYKNKSNFILV
jgi:hypothetical protein